MRTRVGIVLVIVVVAVIALVAVAEERPLIDADGAYSLALDQQAGPDHTGWKADSATLGYNGVRLRGNTPGFSELPKCWGTMLPLGDGYCLPYPIWQVRVIGPTVDGQCSTSQVYVDARKRRVLELFGGSEPC